MSNERERALETATETIFYLIRHEASWDGNDQCREVASRVARTARALLASSPPPSCERMEDALHRIKQWADAYPADVFHPVSDEKLREANETLKAIGVDMGALHAGWARHIVDGIGNIARAALDASRTEEKS